MIRYKLYSIYAKPIKSNQSLHPKEELGEGKKYKLWQSKKRLCSVEMQVRELRKLICTMLIDDGCCCSHLVMGIATKGLKMKRCKYGIREYLEIE